MLGCGGGGGGSGAKPATAPTGATASKPSTADKDAAGPWGPSVPSPETEARVATLLVRMRDAKLEAGDLGTAVVFGPGLWSAWQLAGLNSSEGIPSIGRVRMGDRVVMAHGRAVRFDALAPFMASKPVQATATFFADGEIGPASAGERQLYYMGIAWEIAGKPLTVARKGNEVLVVVLDDEDKLFQLELLGPWYRLATGAESEIEKYQPANPFPVPVP